MPCEECFLALSQHLLNFIAEIRILQVKCGQLLVNQVTKRYEKLQYNNTIGICKTSVKASKYDVTTE